MRYRLTVLTPLLVGDGRRLSAIDYMVWKDHVNVLDQRRIFKLLARGPRLEGYLAQLRKATKLDFASWGGFAQNFAGRRIPFESAAYSAYWERASGESLNIPTFASGASGPYLPGTAIKGALRTGMLFGHQPDLREAAMRASGERAPRRPADLVEDRSLGPAPSNRMRYIGVGDSAPVSHSVFQVHLLRVASYSTRPGWKQSPRGTVQRPEDSAPIFAEMAQPGTVFEGEWEERKFLDQPEIRRALGWSQTVDRAGIFQAANEYAAGLLRIHRQYADWTGLELLGRNLDTLQAQTASARETNACVLCLGWGSGLLGKSAWLDTQDRDYRTILQSLPLYKTALGSGLPFPRTRRIVFLNNQPATLPGWALLEVQ